MDEDVSLKSLSPDGVPGAVQRAEHYRLLNQPEQAESICLDVLDIDPDNQQALVTAALAITDQFTAGGGGRVRDARDYLERLTDDYQRTYYAGVVAERTARAALVRGHARNLAYGGFRAAMEAYEKAAMIRPAGNDDAILRWNSCVRTIRRQGLQPPSPDEGELGLE